MFSLHYFSLILRLFLLLPSSYFPFHTPTCNNNQSTIHLVLGPIPFYPRFSHFLPILHFFNNCELIPTLFPRFFPCRPGKLLCIYIHTTSFIIHTRSILLSSTSTCVLAHKSRTQFFSFFLFP